MRPSCIGVLVCSLISLTLAHAQTSPKLHEKRQLASDLEVGGDLAGLPAGSTRYVAWKQLLSIARTNFTLTDDPNFTGPTEIRGVRLEELARRFAGSPASDMVLAICYDKYLAPYPRDYRTAHYPALVLEVNGQPPAGWPKAAQDSSASMGFYMISNPKFTPRFKVLSHADEPQVPWGVVRLEFRDEKVVLDAIAPRGPRAHDPDVQAGNRIAQQNCFRCHNAGREGGEKAGRSWESLGLLAAASAKNFAAYIRDPQDKNPQAQMPANPQYDDATLSALTAYFRTFSKPTQPVQPAKP